jgi:hypothetical protein
MVTRKEMTIVMFTFTGLSSRVDTWGGTNQLVTEAMLSWTTDDPVPDEDSPFLNYAVLGLECNGDGSICKHSRGSRCIYFSTRLEQWEFLSKLAEQIDHPEIREELARRIAKENA